VHDEVLKNVNAFRVCVFCPEATILPRQFHKKNIYRTRRTRRGRI
jgi:hypothetical protein